MNFSDLKNFTKISDSDILTTRVLRPMMLIIILFLTIGLGFTYFQSIANGMTSLLLALACLLLGGFVGFLFGIPRVLQSDAPVVPPAAPASPGSATPSSQASNTNPYSQRVNTNLEQISDWLTKIIVGLGLVNLNQIPNLLRDNSELIAKGIAITKNIAVVTIFANAIILYFPILGFMSGYLVTRIFLSDLFRKADTGELIVGGQDVGLSDVVKGLVNVVTDATSSDSKIYNKAQASTARVLPKRVLWVDDRPKNNVIEREIMNKAGIEIISALSTNEALEQLNKPNNNFDLVISDMGRDENGQYNSSAGISLLSAMKNPIRTLIYCSKQGADLYGVQARQAGAEDVVQGPDALMRAIGIK
ncbi:DNA-binding transcriptional response regulator [Emticicia fontis]